MAIVTKRRAGDRIFDALNTLFMLCLIFVTIYPLLYVVFASFSDPKGLMTYDGFLFAPLQPMTVRGYELTFQNKNILIGFKNTLLYVVTGTVINVSMTAICAFVVTRKHFVIRRFLSLLFLITMFFSGGIIPNYFVVRNLKMLDSTWAIIVPGAINVYNMIIMRTFFDGIPQELEEAANIEGASDWHVFTRLIIPLSLPVLAVMVLYYGVGHWNSWFSAMLYLKDRGKYPLQLFLREMLLEDYFEQTVTTNEQMVEESLFKELIQYCTIVVSTVPILCIYPFLQRYFVKGIMIGAVKG